jgi:hypothetical protein
MWEGNWRGLPKWFTTLFKCLGIGLYCLAGIFAMFGLWQAVPGPAIAGTVHSFLGFFLFERLKYNFDSAITADEAAEQLGIQRQEFEKLVSENGIRPTHLFNNEPVYNLDSFGDVGVLLRATDGPVEQEQQLLRPARGVPEGGGENLLRPANGRDAALLTNMANSEQAETQTLEQRTS